MAGMYNGRNKRRMSEVRASIVAKKAAINSWSKGRQEEECVEYIKKEKKKKNQ